jgi:hypothetical protein
MVLPCEPSWKPCSFLPPAVQGIFFVSRYYLCVSLNSGSEQRTLLSRRTYRLQAPSDESSIATDRYREKLLRPRGTFDCAKFSPAGCVNNHAILDRTRPRFVCQDSAQVIDLLTNVRTMNMSACLQVFGIKEHALSWTPRRRNSQLGRTVGCTSKSFQKLSVLQSDDANSLIDISGGTLRPITRGNFKEAVWLEKRNAKASCG